MFIFAFFFFVILVFDSLSMLIYHFMGLTCYETSGWLIIDFFLRLDFNYRYDLFLFKFWAFYADVDPYHTEPYFFQ